MPDDPDDQGLRAGMRRAVGGAFDATVGRVGHTMGEVASDITGATAEQVIEEIEPYLVEEAIPRIVDGITPHLIEQVVPRVIDGMEAHLVGVTVPEVLRGVTPALVDELLPRILDRAAPLPRAGAGAPDRRGPDADDRVAGRPGRGRCTDAQDPR